jgi:hypothetical protein
MKPFDDTRREEEKRRNEWERWRGMSEDSMQASGERLAEGWGRVVLRSREELVGRVESDVEGDLRRLSGSGKPVYLMPLNS